MKFSAQEEFGLRCMVALAREGADGFLTIPTIASAEGLTQSHVAKLLSILRKGGFVTSIRGQQGGYALSRHPAQIKVGDLLAVLGGRLCHDGFCDRFTGRQRECVHTEDCTLLPLWIRIQRAVDKVLNDMTLEDLVDPQAGVNVKIFEDSSAREFAHPN
ncbi:MAG TPA: Rrf2 family transcriptional regulator [Fimbriimonadaceae bacterium]|nr:Rrf2 family transcriptional regulator [Fimbriimonadaceae bacterium]